MFIYRQSKRTNEQTIRIENCWEVGYFEREENGFDEFHVLKIFTTEIRAIGFVNFLNGGNGENIHLIQQILEEEQN